MLIMAIVDAEVFHAHGIGDLFLELLEDIGPGLLLENGSQGVKIPADEYPTSSGVTYSSFVFLKDGEAFKGAGNSLSRAAIIGVNGWNCVTGQDA